MSIVSKIKKDDSCQKQVVGDFNKSGLCDMVGTKAKLKNCFYNLLSKRWSWTWAKTHFSTHFSKMSVSKVFSVTRSFRNHSNMLIRCYETLLIISWKQLFC